MENAAVESSRVFFGSCKIIFVNLSTVEIDDEPVERLFMWGHSACSVDQKKILIFGGFGGIGRHEHRNDLLLLDAQSGMVEIVAAMGAPSARLSHTASVVGDFMYVIGGRDDPRNPPEFARAPGGPPSNVAISHVRLGGRDAFIGKVGNDEFGEQLVLMMNEEKVQTRGVKFDANARTVCTYMKIKFEDGKVKVEKVKD